MGLTDLPYHVCQEVMWDKSIAMGDQLDSNNDSAWKKVVLNFPGTKEYYCQNPWLFKQRVHGLLDMELFIYVKNGRTIRQTKHCVGKPLEIGV